MSGRAESMNVFLGAYEHYVQEVLKPAQIEVMRLLELWQDPGAWSKYKRTSRVPIPTPIRATSSRIKRPEQVVDKILRKPGSFPLGLAAESFRGMHDCLGVRLVVYFLSHLPLIDRELRSSEFVEISSTEPPMAYMSADRHAVLSLAHLDRLEKESGYSSVHYTVRLKNPVGEEECEPWFELQVQTLAQDLWSAMEHHLGYKPGSRTSVSARKQFKILSKMIAAIDEHFDLLYEELSRFQEEATYDSSTQLTVENIATVLDEIGVSCAQRDVNNILKFLFSRSVATVRDVRELGTPRRLDIIRNTYLSSTGRLPLNLEIVATLAALRGATDEAEEVQRIKSQIAFRGAWDSIRQEFTRGG